MTLAKSCVLKTRCGRYLDATGNLTGQRDKAARMTMHDTRTFLHSKGLSDPMWGISMEECSKRERRQHAPMSSDDSAALLAITKAIKQRADAARMLQHADELERAARHYRKQSANVSGDSSGPIKKTRRIEVE